MLTIAKVHIAVLYTGNAVEEGKTEGPVSTTRKTVSILIPEQNKNIFYVYLSWHVRTFL